MPYQKIRRLSTISKFQFIEGFDFTICLSRRDEVNFRLCLSQSLCLNCPAKHFTKIKLIFEATYN